MKKRVIRYGAVPFIRNASMIGAGNKFKPMYNENGKIQWTLSVLQQNNPAANTSVLKQKADVMIAANGGLAGKSIPTQTKIASKAR